MPNFDSALGDFDNQPSTFDEWQDPPILFDDGYGLFDSALNNFDDGGINSSTIELVGQELTSTAGSIGEIVSDSIQISGITLTSSAENITASGIQNSNVATNGLQMASAVENISPTVTDSVAITGQEVTSTAQNISANGTQSATSTITGLDLSIFLGNVTAEIADSTSISGIQMSSFVAEISANATQNAVFSVNGIGLQSNLGSLSASGEETGSEVGRGGKHYAPLESRGAKALIVPVTTQMFVENISASGQIFISARANVFSLQTSVASNDLIAEGQLGITDEDLLLLLVA